MTGEKRVLQLGAELEALSVTELGLNCRTLQGAGQGRCHVWVAASQRQPTRAEGIPRKLIRLVQGFQGRWHPILAQWTSHVLQLSLPRDAFSQDP